MKLSKNLLAGAAILWVSVALGADPPLARLGLRSYTDLTNAISRLAKCIDPNATSDPALELTEHLGMTNLAALDAKRPWELALWYGGGEQPLLALKAPVKDVAQFKESLNPEGVLRSKGSGWSQLTNGFGLILFREEASLSDAEKSALNEWKSQPVTAPAGLVALSAGMTEPLREQALGLVSIGKMSVSQALASQGSQMGTGLTPAAMAEVVGLYFDVIETFLKGLQDTTIGLDLTSEALTVENVLTAKPGTDLANWVQKPAHQITAQDLKWVDPDASFSMAGYFGKDPALLKLVQKMVRVSFQVQNMETNGAAAKGLDDLIARMLPVVFAGSVEMKGKFVFDGAYRFPGGNVTENYGQIKQFVTNAFQTFVGKDQMYSAAGLAEKHDTINGTSVDRVTFTLNLDSPLLKLPGQKEQFQGLWPDGKMEFDYAVQGDRLVAATPGRMKEILESSGGKPNTKSAIKLGEGTVLAGYVNPLTFVGQMSAANPGIPEAVKDKLAKLNAQGTGIQFEVRVDKQLRSSTRIPLKLFRELGTLREE